MAGGFVGSQAHQATATVWKYNTASNTYSAGIPLPAARGAGALVRTGRILHFFGGSDANHANDYPDHWTLNIDSGTSWQWAPPMPNPRNHMGYAELGGKIYAIGGQHKADEAHGNDAEVDVFDPATNQWSRAADLPFARSHDHTSSFIFNGKLGIAGGQANGTTAPVTLADVLVYDPAVNKWSALPSLPEPRQAACAAVINSELIVTTGTPAGSNPQTTTWRLKL
jgi:N-acetylneuraminic acid mutarotase